MLPEWITQLIENDRRRRRQKRLAVIVLLSAVLLLIAMLSGCSNTPDPERSVAVTGGTEICCEESTTSIPTTTTTSTTVPETTTSPATVPTTVATTVPPTAPPTTAAVVPASSGSVEAIIYDVFGPEIGPKASRVAYCESKHNPGARSPTNDHGVFQIHAGSGNWPRGWQDKFAEVTGVPFYNGVYDPYLNTVFAKWLYDQSGWGPWACRGA